ncbi:PREDICTED: monocarboxylate transporter 3-like [Priapulus caudatus]|uniref:Monocarboxylate transporter 3-like n=1 Tax=Priapulus caudatus TaxID=37621 RepID=A0ABM1EM54_PRICU|nr:PREDICTED: monocarboxylate transporter 3-like [Priapulus caudatus]
MTGVVKPPDGGWGWMVVLGTAVIMAFVWGQQKAFGIYIIDISDALQVDTAPTALIQGLNLAFLFGMGPPGSVMCRRVGHRAVAMTGAVLAASGLILSYFSSNLILLYILYGVVNGIGGGLLMISIFAVLNEYFKERIAFATGLAVAGNAVGTLVLPLVIKSLNDSYGYKGALLVNGGMALNMIPCAALYRPLRKPQGRQAGACATSVSTRELMEYAQPVADDLPPTTADGRVDAAESVPPPPPSSDHRFSWSIFGIGRYWIQTASLVCLQVLVVNSSIYLPRVSIEVGGDDVNEAIALSLGAITSTIAMVAFSALWDTRMFRSAVSRQVAYCVACATLGVATACVGFIGNYAMLMFWGVVTLPLLDTAAYSPTFMILRDVVTPARYSDALGVSMLMMAPISFVSPFLIASIYDATGTTAMTFVALGTCALAAGLVGSLLPIHGIVCQQKSTDDSNNSATLLRQLNIRLEAEILPNYPARELTARDRDLTQILYSGLPRVSSREQP